MSAPRIILAPLPSLCKKLSNLVEIWRSPAKTILHSFFETRCILTCFLARDQGSLGLRMQDYSLCAGVTICFTAFVMIKAIYRFVNFRRISRKRGNKVYSLLFNRHLKIIWKFARTACWDMNKSRGGYFFYSPPMWDVMGRVQVSKILGAHPESLFFFLSLRPLPFRGHTPWSQLGDLGERTARPPNGFGAFLRRK